MRNPLLEAWNSMGEWGLQVDGRGPMSSYGA